MGRRTPPRERSNSVQLRPSDQRSTSGRSSKRCQPRLGTSTLVRTSAREASLAGDRRSSHRPIPSVSPAAMPTAIPESVIVAMAARATLATPMNHSDFKRISIECRRRPESAGMEPYQLAGAREKRAGIAGIAINIPGRRRALRFAAPGAASTCIPHPVTPAGETPGCRSQPLAASAARRERHCIRALPGRVEALRRHRVVPLRAARRDGAVIEGGEAAMVTAAVVVALLAWVGANRGDVSYLYDDQGVCSHKSRRTARRRHRDPARRRARQSDRSEGDVCVPSRRRAYPFPPFADGGHRDR